MSAALYLNTFTGLASIGFNTEFHMFGSEAACTQPGASCDAQQHYQYQRELGSCFNQTPSVAVWEAPLEVARAPPLLSAVLVVVALPPLEAVEEPTAREEEGALVCTGAARRTSLEGHVSKEQRKGLNQWSKPACIRRCTPGGQQVASPATAAARLREPLSWRRRTSAWSAQGWRPKARCC